jgi:general secretion pathway protein K
MIVRPGERGAALLAVLVLVAIMGALAASAFERVRLSSALATNHASLDQARAYAIGIEKLLAFRIDDLAAEEPGRTTLAGNWNGTVRTIPLPGGTGVAQAAVRDGGNCFNLNSLVVAVPGGKTFASRETGIAQFAGLMRLLAVPEAQARNVAEAAADWADSDSEPNRLGAEDAAYAGAAQPYRTSNGLFAEASELGTLAGVTPEIYARVRPWLCALPVAELSQINPNTLLPGQAALVAMLAPDSLSVADAQAVLASRPAAGWDDLVGFWSHPALARLSLPLDVQAQPQLRTGWFALDLSVTIGGAELIETALVDARLAPARVAVRRWGRDD